VQTFVEVDTSLNFFLDKHFLSVGTGLRRRCLQFTRWERLNSCLADGTTTS